MKINFKHPFFKALPYALIPIIVGLTIGFLISKMLPEDRIKENEIDSSIKIESQQTCEKSKDCHCCCSKETYENKEKEEREDKADLLIYILLIYSMFISIFLMFSSISTRP